METTIEAGDFVSLKEVVKPGREMVSPILLQNVDGWADIKGYDAARAYQEWDGFTHGIVAATEETSSDDGNGSVVWVYCIDVEHETLDFGKRFLPVRVRYRASELEVIQKGKSFPGLLSES